MLGMGCGVVETGTGNRARSADVMEISRPEGYLGPMLPEAKQLLARVQQAVVAAQAHQHGVSRPDCSSCGGRCQAKDWRLHQIATLFGGGDRAAAADCSPLAMAAPRRVSAGYRICRSTPELDQLLAHLSTPILRPRGRAGAPYGGGGRQVFGAVARTDTDIAVLIRRSLKAVGRSGDTVRQRPLVARQAAELERPQQAKCFRVPGWNKPLARSSSEE